MSPPIDYSSNRTWPAAGLLILMTATVYIPVTGCGFIWDDDAYVEKNMALRSLDGLWRIWTDFQTTPQYYPMVHTSYWLEYRLWATNPVGYHLVNVLLHTANSLLLWLLLSRLQVPGAWCAAALFAVHPVQVESVAWITERKNVLSGVFYFAASLAYLQFALPVSRIDVDRSRYFSYSLALLLFVLALLSKTVTCSFPAAVLLILWWKRGIVRVRDVYAIAPFFAVGLGLGMVTVWIEKHQVGASGVDWDLSSVERCLIAGRALWFYAGKLLWPVPLVFFYPRWQIDAGVWWQYLFPLAACAIVAGLWMLRFTVGRGPLVAVLIFAGTLFPALGFFDVYPMRFSFVADHFQYLASASFLALSCAFGSVYSARWGFSSLLVRRFAIGTLVAVLGFLTWNQTHVYRNLETLWRDTVRSNPDAWLAHYNLAHLLRERGDAKEAEIEYREALRAKPLYPEAYNNLGLMLAKHGRLEEGRSYIEQAISIAPKHVGAIINLAVVLERQGELKQAVQSLQLALRHDADSADAHYNLGQLFARQGNLPLALKHFEHALRSDPEHLLALANLSIIHERSGNRDIAIRYCEDALRIRPKNAKFLQLHRQLHRKKERPQDTDRQRIRQHN